METQPFDSLSGKYDKELIRDYFDLCIETAHKRASYKHCTQAQAFEGLVKCYEEFFKPDESRKSAREDFNAFIDFMNDGGEYQFTEVL